MSKSAAGDYDDLLPQRFRVLGELGSGGTSVVYHVLDGDSGHEVAVKILSKDSLEARFRREGEQLAALSHPNVVTFLEVGRHQGRDYLVMEYLPGGDLGSKVRGKTPEEILRLFLPVCAGLGYLHSLGIVHRDVKPPNILFDAAGRPKLSDLGAARQVDQDTRITRAGSILGTYSYLAPEQIVASDVGPAADLYSLGVCIFEMLTGRRPFVADSEFNLMKAHMEQPPPSLLKFRPELPLSVEELLQALLAKKPEDRPTTAGVVSVMLKRCLSDIRNQRGEAGTADWEETIQSLSDDQRSVLLAVGFLGPLPTFEEICRLSTLSEDKVDVCLDALVTAKLLTCPAKDSFALLLPRSVMEARYTPRLRSLFQSRLQGGTSAASGDPESTRMASVTPSPIPLADSGVAVGSATAPLPGPRGAQTRLIDSKISSLPQRSRRGLHLSLVVFVLLLLTAGWCLSHSGQMVISSFPEGADVLVDGRIQGETPLRVKGLSVGTHAVRLDLEGYLFQERQVQVPFLSEVPLDFQLPDSRGVLVPANVPEGSRLTINGAVYDSEDLGKLSLPAGKSRIRLSRDGYRTFFQEVTVEAGASTVVNVAMSPILGRLDCTSDPTGATVWVDGQQRGVTPLLLVDLGSGRHSIEFRHPGYAASRNEVEIVDEAPAKLHATLIPVLGRVSVTSNPSGATVRLNDVVQGTSPLVLTDLKPGQRIVSVTLVGYQASQKSVEIELGESSALSFTLLPNAKAKPRPTAHSSIDKMPAVGP